MCIDCTLLYPPVKLVSGYESLEGAVHHAGQEVTLTHITHEPHWGGGGGGRHGGHQDRDQCEEAHHDERSHGLRDVRGAEIY